VPGNDGIQGHLQSRGVERTLESQTDRLDESQRCLGAVPAPQPLFSLCVGQREAAGPCTVVLHYLQSGPSPAERLPIANPPPAGALRLEKCAGSSMPSRAPLAESGIRPAAAVACRGGRVRCQPTIRMSEA